MTRVIAWHFTGATLRYGRPIPPTGEWLTHDGPVMMCESGLHASRRAIDALVYSPGPITHLVECEDIAEEDDDKFVCRRRRILASVDSTETLWAFSRWAALSVIHLWDAPEVVRRFLETGDESLQAAAWAAARDASWAAAWAAARDASWAAAWAAARDASWAAARDAARDAAWAAARDAARDASWAAVWAAARDAARDAAWAAARDAARDAQNLRLEAALVVALGSKHPVLLREVER